jgi:beta-glucosidase
MKLTKKLLCLSMGAILVGCGQPATEQAQNDDNAPQSKAAAIWPNIKSEVQTDPSVEARVDKLLASMTLEQKVAQMIQPEIRDITVEDMRQYGFGSYLNGGGSFPHGNKQSTPADWIQLAEDMYQASVDDSLDGSSIPTMWGTDAVHGHNNVIGATLFPHNIGLGAANNPELIEKIANVTATEVMVTGIDWVFAPTVATVRDDRWGRTYEGYSEDPEIVKSYASAIVKGLQGYADKDFLSDNRVISTVKHFLGDGGTVGGDDQGDNIATEQELFDIHAQGYVGGLTVGAQSVMASFNSWHGKKIHGHKYLLTDVLKEQMGFDGFVVGDWNGHGQIAGCTNDNCPLAVNAGLDIYMVPTQAWKPLYENTIAQVKDGTIAQSRIDDAVRRILRVKIRAGLFEKPSPAKRPFSGKTELIGAADHRAVARQAVRESLVLLKNNNNLLPLSPNQHILVTGDGADNIGKQSGGWTITWQGTGNVKADFPGGTSIYDGIKAQVEAAGGSVALSDNGTFDTKPDVAVVVFGEDPYAEGHGDRQNLEYQQGDKTDLALLKSLQQQGIPVVSVFISGRPMWVNPEINQSDAFVAAWLPGSEGAGVADVLLSYADGQIQHDFKGKLSFSWPKAPEQATVNRGDSDYDPLFAYGYGLTYQDKKGTLAKLDETVAEQSQAPTERKLLVGEMHKPWLLWLVSGGDRLEVNANTHQLGAIAYRTIDKKVQEDARQLSFDGSQNAALSIVSKSNFREDLRTDERANSALTFQLKSISNPTDKVTLGTRCSGDEGSDWMSCYAELDITNTINQLPLDNWQEVSIDLACFAEKGMEFSDTVAPFNLGSAGEWQFAIADIVIKPEAATNATISCQ